MAGIFILNRALLRELWFDEALTFLNFAMLPDIAAIYRNYVIPNNQILFTVLLKYWHELALLPLNIDVYLRVLPLIFAIGTLGVLLSWRRYFSNKTLYLIMAAMVISLPFEIYSVALRAYMLSLFLMLLCITIAFRVNQHPTPWNLLGYFLAAMAGVAALPSNIVVLGGIAWWFLPFDSLTKCLKINWWYLAVSPLTALALFYLPITPQVQGVLALKEGWNSGINAATAFYLAFLLSFLPLVIASLIQPYSNWRHLVKIAGIILLPLPFFLIRTPAPFPRVFFPYWAILMLLLVEMLNGFIARHRRHSWLYPLLAASIIITGLLMQVCRLPLSETIGGQRASDDYFYPGYCRPDFQPRETVILLTKQFGSSLPPTYISFMADFYPIVFYGLLEGLDAGTWRFDGPRNRVENLHSGNLVILSNYPNELDNFIKRFGVEPVFLMTNGFHRIYRIP